jgi:hypothetical protein
MVKLMTLGQVSRLRRMTVGHARLMPGESVLEVGCGTGGVTISAKILVGRDGRIEDLPKLLREAGFEDVEQLQARFLNIGFVRAKKACRLTWAGCIFSSIGGNANG